MSDMSYRWCKRCKQPEYACECEDPDLEQESPVSRRLQGKTKIWEDDYFYGRKKP
jgi:hypothetical protein